MDLVEIGHRAVLFGDVADFLDRRDVAIHRIDRFEGDDLRHVAAIFRQQPVEILRIIVLPDALLGPGVADALDHRGMVAFVGEDDAARDVRSERAERGPVGDIAGGEQQRRLLAVQVGKLALKHDVVVVGAGDVAGAAGAGAAAVERLVHGGKHGRVLAHAEIIVGAPHGHLAGAVPGVADGAREIALLALQLGKHPVASFANEGRRAFRQRGPRNPCLSAPAKATLAAFLAAFYRN